MTLLYFAWVKERIGKGEEGLPLPPGVTTVSALLEHLRGLGPDYAAALGEDSALRIAVNQEMAGPDAPVSDADEVAIFPPMTGG